MVTLKKIYEHTYGCHIFMKIEMDGSEYDIDCYLRSTGEAYRTSADYDKKLRHRLIRAFKDLY